MTRIRPAEPANVPALAALAQRTWADAFGWSVSPEELAAELENRSEASFAEGVRTWTTLVAEDGDALVGYVQFGDVGIAGVDVQPGDQELHQLYVDTPLQGRGITRAVRLYEDLGFRVVGTTTFMIGSGQSAEDLVMVRDAAG